MNKDGELSKIAEEIRKCRLCRKWGTGRPVPGEGSSDANLVFIGEAPGKEEAKIGRPFVGRSGRLLRSLLEEIGLSAEEVYITSPVKYLPLRGTPSRENILHSRQHLMQQLSIIRPQTVVLLGSVACIALLDRKVEITKEHGTSVRKEGLTFFITYHPAYALRFPKGKEALREDLGKLARTLVKQGVVGPASY